MARKKRKPMFGGKKAAPFKSGGKRDTGHPHTAKGTMRRGAKRK
jgi:hypothetical protein